MIKLNLACGKDIKDGFLNIDMRNEAYVGKIDIAADITMGIPFSNSSVDMIYTSHFVEHLDSVELEHFFREAWRILKPGGFMRLVWPDFNKVFRSYVNNDKEFFRPFIEYLNNDAKYYQSLLNDPELTKQIRGDEIPSWHTDMSPEKRRLVRLRTRTYATNAECVEWFVHQYGEHKNLLDYETLCLLAQKNKYSLCKLALFDPSLDNGSPLRKDSSIYAEVYK